MEVKNMEKKKDYSLVKILCIPVLLYLVLTWIIPAGSFSGGEFVKGDVIPLGLYGLFVSPVYSFAVFAQYIVLILCIGGFYGVLNKTGVYQKIINFFAGKDKTKFLIATVCIFALVTSILGETMLVFILLPFFISILLKLGYDKVSSIAATVGASLVGTIASISGNMAIYKAYFSLEPKLFVLFNIIMLIIFTFLLCMLILSKNIKSEDSKNKKLEVVKDIPLYEGVKDNKKSVVPLIIILVITLLLIILGSYNWYYSFGVEIFTNLHEKISSIELFGVSIFNRVLGNFSEIGYFSNYDLSAILLIFSILTAWIYNVSINDFIEGFKKGVKDMLLPGVYIILASIVFSQVVTSSANVGLTISNYILSSNFNIVTGVLTGIVGSFFYNDYLYFVNGMASFVSLYDTNMILVMLNVFQSMFGIMMLVLPVSIALIGGLKYLNVSYKDWIKYIWKFLIQIFVISMIGSIIFSMII